MTKLDDHDLKILETLQEDGRITKVKLAEAVNLSPSPTWERLKRLEQAGIITGYHAHLDLKRLGATTTVMVEVMLKRHKKEDFAHFENAVRGLPEILGCWGTGGNIDYMMQVVARDVDAYQRFMDNLLESDIGIDRYFGYVVTKHVKSLRSAPVAKLVRREADGSLEISAETKRGGSR